MDLASRWLFRGLFRSVCPQIYFFILEYLYTYIPPLVIFLPGVLCSRFEQAFVRLGRVGCKAFF
jgi:hypothetical protein